MNLTLEDFCTYYASSCKQCFGDKRFKKEGVWTTCPCQNIANIKWRVEQIRVHPPELKLLTWDDFTGVIKEDAVETGMLTVSSAMAGKQKALEYCYRGSRQPENLILHKHLDDGANLIIGGAKHTGKTLLGLLVVKEVVRTAVVRSINLSFDWIQSSDLKQAARWDTHKEIDHARLEQLAEVDFLVIDDVDVEGEVIAGVNKGHKTSPPDRTSLNVLFGQRDLYHRPTIILCSQRFMKYLQMPLKHDDIETQWGNEFLNIVTNPRNTVIYLERERLVDTQ
jgi:hypothetical protein